MAIKTMGYSINALPAIFPQKYNLANLFSPHEHWLVDVLLHRQYGACLLYLSVQHHAGGDGARVADGLGHGGEALKRKKKKKKIICEMVLKSLCTAE